MGQFFDLTLNGITNGMIYSAVALGLVLIWRATRILNFAAGAMAMFTTYIASSVLGRDLPYWIAFILALAAGFVLGALVERILVRPVENKSPVNAVIVTLGLLVALEGLAGMIYGGDFRSFPPALSQNGISIGGRQVAFSLFDLFTLGTVVVLCGLLAVMFRGTPVGLRMRASAFAPEVARLLGVRVGRVLTLGWALAAVAGSLAGLLVAPKVFLSPNNMDPILVFGFTAAIVGGLDSAVGAVVGGLITGLALSYVGGYLGSSVETFGAFAILGLLLMIRPRGLFSHGESRPEGGGGAAAASHSPPAALGLAGPQRSQGWLQRVQSRLPGWFNLRQPMLRHLAYAVIVAAVMFFVSSQLFGAQSFSNTQLANVATYAIAIAGLTLLTGANGQISLGHGALMAVGGYATALILLHLTRLPLAVAILGGGVAAAVFGIVVGIAAARLRGPYLAGLTLALAVGLPSLAVKFSSLLGGDQGLSLPPVSPPSPDIDQQMWLAWISVGSALLVMVLLANLLRSRFGRQFRAVRDDEVASALAGIPVARTQVTAFVVSGACAGIAGALFAINNDIVTTGQFQVALSISLLTGMVLGGTGSLVGAVWGAILVVYIPTWATSLSQSLHISDTQASNVALIMYGAALIIVIILAPAGIQGIVRRLTGLSRSVFRRSLNRSAST